MENFKIVREKLEAFVRKYYLNLILKGSLLFLAIGLLYFLLIVSLEYFLWLSGIGRAILFWVFIVVEVFLLIRFVGIPLAKLLKLSGGIDPLEAADLIGKHFPEVSDKLRNLLQLKHNSHKSDLLLASIDQRSRELTPIPFTSAIDFKRNRKHLKFLIFPVLIILGLIVAGRAEIITQSFSRISDYNTVYLKPAPFQFIVQNSELTAREGEDYTLQVKTIGDYNPDAVQLIAEDSQNFMKQTAPGVFVYSFNDLSETINFKLKSNEVVSTEFALEVIKVPKLLDFEMELDYPDYIGLNDEVISGPGNISVPEGTRINWNFSTQNVVNINFKTSDSVYRIATEDKLAEFTMTLSSDLPYSVSSSNELIQDYERLGYSIKVIKDQYPEIEVTGKKDGLNTEFQYYKGNVSDDYGLRRLELVYFSEEDKENTKNVNIPVSKESFDEFHFSFPGNIQLESGQNYLYFFRIYDNDAVNGAKSSKSETFSYRKKTEEEIREENLQEQNDAIQSISKELKDFEESEEKLKEISQLEKENESLDYNERKKLEEFIKRQKQQNELMKSYSEKLEKGLEKNENEELSPMEKELGKRLETNEKRLEQNEQLLKELEEYSERIQKEDLGKKLEDLSKQNMNNQRSLEQLLELTKQYYVEEKKQKLARDLNELSEKQEDISEDSEENTPENQDKLNEEFEDFREQMDELEKENEQLKQPKDLGREEVDEESIKKDQEDASKDLKENDKEAAKQKQKDAAKKMKQMSGQMQQMSMQQQGEQLEADAETLRQILDNLILFSFEQEGLLADFKGIQQNNPGYAAKLKEQSNLRENFRHVDDSLYALALRNPMINEKITAELTDIEFDLEKSIERLSDNEIPQGTASQQYVVTGANDLANLLSDILSGMQEMMANPQPGSGEGGEGFQLPDIIRKQKELSEKMKEGSKKKQDGQPGEQGKPEQQGEGESGDLYEIYKEQQMLRMQMEKLLEENGMGEGDNPAKKMEKFEEELLDKGFDPETAKRMEQLQYELIKFQEAEGLQGMDDKRKSETNEMDYDNSIQNQIDRAKEYFNSTEILNRQTLPLRPIYREKVKDYFGKGND